MLDLNQREMRLGHHLSVDEKHPRHTPSVLIVDDDVDWAIAVQSIFLRIGCYVECALDAKEARRLIGAGKADIIVLDWMLDHETRGDEVMQKAMLGVEKFGMRPQFHKPKIITFSSKSGFEVELPPSPYYEHFDHWLKPIRVPELTQKALGLVNRVGF